MNGTRFRAVDSATIRMAAQAWPDEAVPWPRRGDAAEIRGWLRAAWQMARVAEAVWVASPQFASRVEAACASGALDADHGWRIALALARYLVRAGRRATPFGLFSGIAALRFDTMAAVTSSGQETVRARPDAGWLASLVSLLEAYPGVHRSLLVQANNLAVVRGPRVVVERRPHASMPVEGTVSVRNTEAVQLAVALASQPLPWVALVDKIAAAFPAFPRGSAEALVAGLVEHGVLISALRPASTCPDPLRHVLDQLDAAHAGSVDVQLPVVAQLRALHADLAVGAAGAAALRQLADRMRRVVVVPQPLAVDLRLADRVVLPNQVATEIVAAVDVLRRLTPDPTGRAEWRAYRARFVERHGMSTVVPLAELVDPLTGLGYPEHFSTAAAMPAATSGRDERLLQLAQQAVIDGVREVVLDDAAVAGLAEEDHNGFGHVSTHVDVAAEVRAVSVDALTAGRFTVALTGMGRSAVATSGRFLGVLPDADRERMCREIVRLPVAVDGAMLAQVSFPPPNLHAQNVLTCRQVLPWLISLGEHRAPAVDVIGVDDLGVAAGRDRLVLVSMSRRRVVEPTVAHAAAVHTMPLLARFLVELPRATDARLAPFDWGAAACLPFRPALRYGRVLLTAPRWRVDPARLPAKDAGDGAWRAAWDRLRAKLRLPEWVQVGSGDQRLRLNPDHPLDRALLRAHLDANGGPVTMVEAAGPADFGWLSGRAHEIVAPVASTVAPAPAPAAVAARDSWPPPTPAEPVLPGSCGLLSASLAVEPSGMESVLLRGLPKLLAAWDELPLCWFVRRRHPVPQLRLRLHTDDYGDAAVRVGRWAATLRLQGLGGDLTLDTYRPESGRYGDGPAMAAAHELFAADSTAALAQLRALADHRVGRQALTAVSMIDLAAAMLGSRSDACEWLVAHPEQTGRAPIDRAVLRHAVTLDPATLPDPVLRAWQQRSRAAALYADALSAAGGPLTAGVVLASLLHLHYVRALGPDEAAEQVTYRLARHIALAAVRRRARTAGAAR